MHNALRRASLNHIPLARIRCIETATQSLRKGRPLRCISTATVPSRPQAYGELGQSGPAGPSGSKAYIPPNPTVDIPAIDDVNAEDLPGAEFEAHMADACGPGDYVELPGSGSGGNAVILKALKMGIYEIALESGEVELISKRHGTIYLGRLFDPAVAAAASTDHGARVQLMKDMRVFRKKVDAALYQVRRVAHGHLYNQFRAGSPDAWSSVSLKDAVTFVRQQLSPDVELTPELLALAVHKYIFNETDYFCLDIRLDLFRVVPTNYIRNFREVNDWTQRNDPRMTAFIDKARDILRFSGNLQAKSLENGDGEVALVPNPSITFTEDDKTILRFLRQSLSRVRLVQPTPYEATLRVISLSLDRKYLGNSDFAFMLLRDLGVSPFGGDVYAEVSAFRPWTSRDEEALEREAKEIIDGHTARMRADGVAASDLPTYGDGVDGLRRDWGDMAVYVIDDATAQELDDGISIEPLADGAWWVHVHIADPTAFLRPTHEVSRAAEERMGNLYLMDRTLRMLPQSLTTVSGLRRGLDGAPVPVMTFSAKVDTAGKLVESNVRPAFVRNVKVMDYDRVDELYGARRPRLPAWPDAVQRKPSHRVTDPITESDRSILLQLREATIRSIYQRAASGAINSDFGSQAELTLLQKPPRSFTFPPVAPTYYKGFPPFACLGQFPVYSDEGGSRGVVAEVMSLAGRAAGVFAERIGAPTIRRYSVVHNKEVLEPIRDPKTGFVPLSPEFDTLIHESGNSTSRTGHDWLGFTEPYLRVTSPLRRYVDMVHHWQLKAAMGGREPPPFSVAALDVLCLEMGWVEKHNKRVMKDDNECWTIRALKTLLDQGRMEVKGVSALVTGHRRRDVQNEVGWMKKVLVADLGLYGVLQELTTEEEEATPLGSTVTVDLKRVMDGRTPWLYFTLSK